MAAIAVGRVGRANVLGVGMPGPYSSEGSVTRAHARWRTTSAFELQIIPIKAGVRAYQQALAPAFFGPALEA